MYSDWLKNVTGFLDLSYCFEDKAKQFNKIKLQVVSGNASDKSEISVLTYSIRMQRGWVVRALDS